MSDGPVSDPRTLWPDLREWEAVGMAEPVYRVRTPAGIEAYVRPDDGSAPLLRHLAVRGAVPAPEILDARDGWLLLRGLPGIPLHNSSVWHHRPTDVARIIGGALQSLERADLTHGDLCLPNILGDPRSGHLAGIVDWRYAERFDREIDVGAALWSCGFNGYGEDVTIAVLRGCAWPVTDAWEVARLIKLWHELTDPHVS